MLKTKAEWDDAYSLPFLLARSQGFKASDDRDRIYAFLGLAHSGYAITPDYSASNTLCHVLTETTKNIILFENRLNVLSALGTYRCSRRPGLPSWVVDWTSVKVPIDASMNFNAVKSTPPHRDQAIVSFKETTFPNTFQAATVMEVTGIFATLIPDLNRCPVFPLVGSDLLYGDGTTNLEVWYLGEFPFALKSESYGYRIIRRVGAFVDYLQVPSKQEALARAIPRVISIF
ncbi:hypothetical protein NW767_011864 [Fusarium falciforme]|nr:hypothetical protein NW767_011864 [Fusarium falciforme]